MVVKNDYVVTADLISAYIHCNDFESASELLVGLIRQSDLPFDILSKCASSFHVIGDFELEVDALERALMMSPGNRSIMIRLADAYLIFGLRDKASRLYDILKEGDPDDVSVTVKKVMLDVTTETSASGIVDDMIDDSDTLMDLAHRTLESGKADDALQIYRKVIENNPDRTGAHVAVMEILLKRGDVADVIAMASETTHMFHNDARIMKILGDAYHSLGDDMKAAQAYTDAMRLGMDTAELYGLIGTVSEAVGMLHIASENYRLAMEKDILNQEYKLNTATLELKLGNYESARLLFKSILIVEPHNMEALRMFTSLCARRNDSEGILALFDDIMDSAVDASDIRFFESVLRDVGEEAKADIVAFKLSS